METLWPVIVGGVIGVTGGLVGPPVVHWLQAKERERRLRAEKFEALVIAIMETNVWLTAVQNAKLWGAAEVSEVCPITKAYAIATIYFPYLLTKVNELNNVTLDHLQWLAQAALKKHEHVEGYADDIAVSYGPFMNKMNEMIGDLNRTARKEFGKKQPAGRLKDALLGLACFAALRRGPSSAGHQCKTLSQEGVTDEDNATGQETAASADRTHRHIT
jgi:hypothetical protein